MEHIKLLRIPRPLLTLLCFVTCVTLSGCGSLSSIVDPHKTNYVLCSEASAGGVVSVIKGGASSCKVTAHGEGAINYEVRLENGQCFCEASDS